VDLNNLLTANARILITGKPRPRMRFGYEIGRHCILPKPGNQQIGRGAVHTSDLDNAAQIRIHASRVDTAVLDLVRRESARVPHDRKA
jgi:hypothetical protein